MNAFKPITLALLATCLALGACTYEPTMLDQPRTMPDGKIYYPPAGGWPQDRGGESGGGGGRN